MLYDLRRGPGVLPAPLPVRADFFPFWRLHEEAYKSYLPRLPPDGRRGVTSSLDTPAAYDVFVPATSAFEACAVAGAANTPVLAAALAFHAGRPDDPMTSLLRR